MFLNRLMIRIRITLILLFVICMLTLIGGAIYINHQGLNKGLRDRISQELEKRNIFITFDSLKFNLSSGIVAENVTVYTDKTRSQFIAKVPSISVNVDKTKFLRGIQKIESVTLKDANIEIPLDPSAPDGVSIKLSQITGKIEFLDNSTISTDKLTANYHGINLEITTNLWQQARKKPRKFDPNAAKKRAEAYKRFLKFLDHWTWDSENAPSLKLLAEGDINSPELIQVKFELESPLMNYKKYQMVDVLLTGDFSHNMVTIDEFSFNNNNNPALFVGDYDLVQRNGSFHIDSSIHLKQFAANFFDLDILKGTQFDSSEIHAEGTFKLARYQSDAPNAIPIPRFLQSYQGPQVQVIGRAVLKNFRQLGSQFDHLSSDFSWNNGDLYLDKLNAKSKDGSLKGKILIKNHTARYKITSTLPLRAYKPFLPKTQAIETQLAKIQSGEESSYYFNSTGTINTKDLTDLNASGELSISHVGYNHTFNIGSITSRFNWKNRILQADLKITGANFKQTKLNTITSKIAWGNNIFELRDFACKDIGLKISSLRTIIKKKAGKIAANLTLVDTTFKHLHFKQLDADLGWKGTGEDAHYGGLINISQPTFKSSALENILTDYRLTAGGFILPKLTIKHGSGTLTGKIEKKADGYVYFDLLSTLDPRLYVSLIKQVPVQNIILKGDFNEKSKVHVTVLGKVNASNPKDWYSEGAATIQNFSYNGVPLIQLKANYWLDKTKFIAENGSLIFDYSHYSLRPNKKKGPNRGWLNVEKVIVDHKARTVTLQKIVGKAYPAPVTRMFHSACADHIEQYRFYNPPSIRAHGVFDTIARPVAERKLDFYIDLACPNSSTLYKFLGANHLLNDLSANIHIRKNIVYVNNLNAKLFNGKVKGQLAVTIPSKGDSAYTGDFSFSKLSFAQLGMTHNFEEIPKGMLSGQIRFTGVGSDIKNFNATGNISLSKGDIFSVPVLGPISLILNPILGKGTFNERLKNLSANFTITHGVIRTDNIQSLTPSMTFTGAGIINLNNDKIDMTIRINYRGLIGMTMQLGASVARLPFHVLRGLFLNKKPEVQGLLQVRGTGNYKDPKWRVVQFDIQRGFKGKLFNPPKAIIVKPNP